jgi:F-type H+-transporting ATPase subunit epsilon
MKTFELLLQDATHTKRVSNVSDFIGEDASGSFGIRADHVRMITSLRMGLARFRRVDDDWQYLAMPGALLYFVNNTLILNTRHFMLEREYTRIISAMQQQLLAEEQELHSTKASLQRMEEEVLRRMWHLDRMEV